MPQFLIDSNLPYYFSLWRGKDYIHQFDIGESWSDDEIWEYSKKHNLVIVSKDADFYNRLVLALPPPKVVHIKLGNMRMNEMHVSLNKIWPYVIDALDQYKLVVVYRDRLELLN